jgi:methyl-accepting chemotaxis protein
MKDDIWWEFYKRYLIDMKLKNKTLMGFLMLSTPPMLMLALAAVFLIPDPTITSVILALDLLGVLIIFYWANVFSKNVSRQIVELANDSKEIAEGNLEYQIKAVESGDEVGALVESVKKMMDNLLGSLQSTASVIYGLGEAVYVTDCDLKVTQFNPAAEALLGYTAAEIVGKPCYEFTKYVGIDAACHTPNCSSTKVVDGIERIISREVTLQNKTGEQIPVEISTSPYLDGEGNVIGAVKLVKDLRRIKEKEAEIIQSKDELERRVDLILPIVTAASEGDLTHIVESDENDAFGTLTGAIGLMIDSLHDVVLQVIEMSLSVSSTAEQLASSSEEMNATTEEVSSSVQQVSQSAQSQVQQLNMASDEMKNMAQMIQNIAASAQSASEVAESANQIAHEGGQAAEEAVKKMRDANEVVSKSSAVVKELGETSKQIGEIVDLITNIAEQTNLLALNAAIEAARAGEHGRGFAVVAEEVSKLAEGSAKAAKQIADLISGMQANTEHAVDSMERGATEVNEATVVVDKALGALETILEGVSEVTAKVEEISTASQTQSMATETVVRAIDDITTAAEEAAAGTEQVSAATEEQTASMQEITSTAQELANTAIDQERVAKKFKIRDKGAQTKEKESSSPDETQE